MKMYYELNEDDVKRLKRAEDLTCTMYLENNNLVEPEVLMSCVSDLLIEVDRLQEEIKELKDDDIEYNRNPYDEHGN